MRRYLCGVDMDKCEGGLVSLPKGMSKIHKAHSSPQEAFKCHARWLIKQGCTQVGPREFLTPEGYTRVLTKKSKFGAELRQGKTGEGMKGTNRCVVKKSSGSLAGTIIC